MRGYLRYPISNEVFDFWYRAAGGSSGLSAYVVNVLKIPDLQIVGWARNGDAWLLTVSSETFDHKGCACASPIAQLVIAALN